MQKKSAFDKFKKYYLSKWRLYLFLVIPVI